MHHKHKGAYNELRAAIYLLQCGYEVFRNVSSHGLIDIVAIKGDEVLRLDVKAAAGTRATDEQLAAGVKFIVPTDDGLFVIITPQPNTTSSCAYCGKVLPSRRRYCSQTCCQAYRRRFRENDLFVSLHRTHRGH